MGGTVLMDRSTLIRAMGNTDISDEECGAFNAALVQAGCTTVSRAAMFCAQIGHESVGLRYYEEIASGAAYEGRRDLGNTQPGDGVRFKGRGPIQVTGRANYDTLSRWAFDHRYVPTPTYFVDRPAELGTVRYGFLGAVWYWTVARNMNRYADRGDIYGASVAVNGGTNGLSDRTRRWNECRAIGPALLPTNTGGFLMGLNDDQQQGTWRGSVQWASASKTVRAVSDRIKPFLPKSFSNPDGVWPRDELDAVVNEVVWDGYDITSTAFGHALVDFPDADKANMMTWVRVIAARQQAIRAQLNRIEAKL